MKFRRGYPYDWTPEDHMIASFTFKKSDIESCYILKREIVMKMKFNSIPIKIEHEQNVFVLTDFYRLAIQNKYEHLCISVLEKAGKKIINFDFLNPTREEPYL